MKSDASIIEMCVSLHAYAKDRNLANLDQAIDRAIKTAKGEVAAKGVLCDSCRSMMKYSDYRGPNA